MGNGVLLASDAKSAAVVMIDFHSPQFNSTLLLVNKTDNSIIKSMSFSDDFLVATINDNVLYLYNSGLGYFLNANNGGPLTRIFSMDNYRDVTKSNNFTNMQTTAFIAGLAADGSPIYKPNLTFSGIAYGCFISGST